MALDQEKNNDGGRWTSLNRLNEVFDGSLMLIYGSVSSSRGDCKEEMSIFLRGFVQHIMFAISGQDASQNQV